MRFLKDNNGFSLTSVLVAAGLLGMLALGVATISRQMSQVSSTAQGQQDFIELKNEMNQYLGDEIDCKASLEGVKFRASEINTIPVSIEVWSADSTGKRNRLVVSSEEKTQKNKYGKIKISSLYLTLPDHIKKEDFVEGENQTAKGRVTLRGERLNMGIGKPLPKVEKIIQITFDTNKAGISTITECQAGSDNGQLSCTAMGGDWDTTKDYCVLPGTRLGFCTNSLGVEGGSGNANTVKCPDVPGFTMRKVRGTKNGTSDLVSCCYIPDQISSQGWCTSKEIEGADVFEECDKDHPLYYGFDFWGKNGESVSHQCCFLPKDSAKTHPFCTERLNVSNGTSGCGTFDNYKSVENSFEMTITATTAKEMNCCWYAE